MYMFQFLPSYWNKQKSKQKNKKTTYIFYLTSSLINSLWDLAFYMLDFLDQNFLKCNKYMYMNLYNRADGPFGWIFSHFVMQYIFGFTLRHLFSHIEKVTQRHVIIKTRIWYTFFFSPIILLIIEYTKDI